jgi:hypothetical protein
MAFGGSTSAETTATDHMFEHDPSGQARGHVLLAWDAECLGGLQLMAGPMQSGLMSQLGQTQKNSA